MPSVVTRLTLALALTLAPALAFAGDFVPLPLVGGKSKQLEIRFVRYTGGASGKMIVDIHNRSPRRATFRAKGLFFVPQGDPERAPQRLGAAGPFESAGQQLSSIKLAPGARRRLELQVFCLDSHRSSPGAGQVYKVARQRLPRRLQNTIETGAHKILLRAKGGTANSAIQSHVWKTRNEKWIKLEGERKSEKSSSGPRFQRRLHPNRIQLQQLNQSLR